MLDDVAASVLFSEVYDAWLDEILQTAPGALERAVRRGFDTTHLRRLAEVLHEHRAALPCVLAPNPAPDPAAFLDAVETAADQLRAELGECTNPDADAGYRQALALIEWSEALLEQRGSMVEVERRALFRAPNVRRRAGNKGNWASDAALAALRTAAESLDDEIGIFADALRGEVIAEIVPLVEGFVDRYTARRRADGVADFDDLLVWARDLLRNPQVRVYFNNRYRCVLIDEFQDTDPVQAEIAMLLTDVDGDGVPEPGRLVVVGDPKQSIYRFRRADIAIYDEVKFGPLAAGQTLIQQNFRAVEGLLDWVNRVFDDAFGAGERGTQPPHVPLLAARRRARRDSVRRWWSSTVTAWPPGQTRSASRRPSASPPSSTSAVRSEPWTVCDPDTGQHRPATWRDCVILLPARTGIEFYIDALAARGIPYRAETRGAFFGTPEVAELIALLRAVDDPTDTPSIVATLRSRAFGCSDDDLLAYSVAARGRIDYRDASLQEPEPVVEALGVLRDLYRQRRGLSLTELVRRAIEAAGFIELALARGGGGDGRGGAQVAANVLKVADQARAFTVSGGGGLRAFTRWLDQQQDQEVGEAEASVSEESDDIVRLMTIHAAKGLEFPIVLLANLNTDARRPEGPFSDPVAQRVAFRVGTGKTGHFLTSDFTDWAEREKAQLARRTAAPALRRAHPRTRPPRRAARSPAGEAERPARRPRRPPPRARPTTRAAATSTACTSSTSTRCRRRSRRRAPASRSRAMPRSRRPSPSWPHGRPPAPTRWEPPAKACPW